MKGGGLKYFVSYWQGDDEKWQMGRCEVERDKPIQGIADVVGLETDLKREFKTDVVVLSFKLFEDMSDVAPRRETRG